MNKQYRAGRAFEYRRKAAWQDAGYVVLRTAGSHGFADLIAIKPGGDVVLLQCKTTKSSSSAKKLLQQFKDTPPIVLGRYKIGIEIWDATNRTLLAWFF